MAELDKKIQKAPSDLVQAVLEAQERKNVERVDMLITNAIKQLKMSRFKPDQTTFISLTYLAKINPKIFSQSNAIKDVLKSLLRRDNGPTNIKGKNDNTLPLLAANILLACSDCPDVRSIILTKVEHWLGSNQKVTELIQHLLATICIKCQGDQQTINSLIDMRQHWLRYLEDNYDTYGCVPADLCVGIRNLLDSETSCDSLILYLRFLIKHDTDIEGLSNDVGKFIIERPISLETMRQDSNLRIQLNKLILNVFVRLFSHLKKARDQDVNVGLKSVVKDTEHIVKKEMNQQVKQEDNKDVIPNIDTSIVKQEYIKTEKNNESGDEQESKLDKKLYVNLSDCNRVTVLNKTTLEAILNLLCIAEVDENSRPEFDDLINNLVFDNKTQKRATIFEDYALRVPYNIPNELRQKLIHSPMNLLVDFALQDANIDQLMNLFQQFGTSIETINKIIKKLELIQDVKFIEFEIKDIEYIAQLTRFYDSMGVSGTQSFLKRLTLVSN